MSRSNLLNLKKNNQLLNVNHDRHTSPNLTARNAQKEEQQEGNGKKLYTFCSSENKPTQKENDQNKENVNMTTRERKVSINNVKGKFCESSYKISMKNEHDTSGKDKKKYNNMSVTCINTLNAAFEKKKNQNSRVEERDKDKKVNISINIHPKTKELDESNKKEMSGSKNFCNLVRREKTPGKNSCQMKPLGKSYIQGGKQKIIVQEEQLLKFTQKFAQEKFIKDEKINKLEQKICEYQRLQNEWRIKSKQYDEYMMTAEQERFKLQDQLSELKSKVSMLRNDNEYYIIAKDESRRIIKDQQLQIAMLHEQLASIQEELNKQKQSTLILNQSKNDYKELVDAVRLLEIQNQHLSRELQINNAFNRQLIMRKSHSNAEKGYNSNDMKVNRLMEENRKMKEQMKQCYLQKIHADIYQKTIEQCNSQLTALQKQNQMLRNKFKFDCQSLKRSQNISDLEFQSNHNQRSATQPSEVECLWKRESSQTNYNQQPSDFRTRTFDSNILTLSGIDWR